MGEGTGHLYDGDHPLGVVTYQSDELGYWEILASHGFRKYLHSRTLVLEAPEARHQIVAVGYEVVGGNIMIQAIAR